MEQYDLDPKSDKIDLVELLQKIWQGRKIAIKMGLMFALVGIIFSLSNVNIYTATTTFIPKGKSSGSVGGRLSGFASLAGIDLGSMNGSDSDIPPSLYPMLIKSNPFIETLLKVKVPNQGVMIRLQDYLSNSTNKSSILKTLKKYTIGLPGLIKIYLSGETVQNSLLHNTEGIKKLTIEEDEIFKRTRELISLVVDKKDGFVTLSVKSEDPQVAAIVVQNAQNLLQQEIIDFKIKNAQELLTFTESLYAQKKNTFESLQDELASFRDQHINISSGLFENKLSRLESELAIASAVNEELAKQVQQARIQVSKDTPIFTIIDPVVIPNQKTSPKRALIVIGFAFLGFFVSLGYTLIKEPFAKIRKQILEDNKAA